MFRLYKYDFTRDTLQVQLSTLHANYCIKEDIGIHGVLELVRSVA